MSKISIADNHTDLRRGIDHVGVSVCAVVHDGNGKILLMKRGPKARDENGRWDIVGGALEHGEKLLDAVQREIGEELLTNAQDITYVHTYEAHRVHNGQPTHWIAVVHTALVDPATVKIGEPQKIAEIGWFGLNDLPQPRHSMFDYALEVAQKAKIIR